MMSSPAVKGETISGTTDTPSPRSTIVAIAISAFSSNNSFGTIFAARSACATNSSPREAAIPRTGVDGQSYAIHFRLHLPITGWNGRFYLGGGTDGTLLDPSNVAAPGYATIGTDLGHDNVADNALNAGGTASFGVDPQARIDFAYNSYDEVARTGKSVVEAFYKRPASFSYFVGCSEGGREAMLMSQKFPTYFDGIVAGDPAFHLPLGSMSGLFSTQLFAGLARRMGLTLVDADANLIPMPNFV